ncbi:hypothetical protein [Nonomuraea sp. NPDC049607]|uniref:tetratricopeptide repeat protein n=2 Tax=unclassified Nonomuraea TaxID=2593643 RepID=UPI00341F169B
MTISMMSHDVDRHPYVGGRPFRTDEASQFFGRDEVAAELSRHWARHRVTVLAGASGVGKTSLINARIVSAAVPVGSPLSAPPLPLGAVPEHNPYALALLSTWSPAVPPHRLVGLSIYEFLRGNAVRSVVVDRVEQVFEGPPQLSAHRDDFLAQMREVIEEMPDLRMLVSIREERLGDLESALGPLEPYRLGPLTERQALEAVEGPIRGSGRWFAEGAAEEIVSRTGGPGGVDPVLLQAACSDLWASLPADTPGITVQDVRTRPGVERSLTLLCGRAIREVARDHNVSALRLTSALQRAFAPGRTGGITREELSAAVLRALEDEHVLKGGTAYRLRHELLAAPLMRVDVPELQTGEITPERYLESAESALSRLDLTAAERLANAALATAEEDDLSIRAVAESRLGDVAHLRRHPAQAVDHYRTAAALFEAVQENSAVARLLAAIGRSLLAKGKDAEAVETMRSAVDRTPADSTLQTELGRVLWLVGQARAGVTVLTDVLNADSRAPEALRTRGEMLADLGQPEAALRDLNQVGRHLRPEGRAARALALSTMGRPGEAEEDVQAALSAGSGNGPALLYAARVRELGGNRTGAADLARLSLAATAPALAPHQHQAALQLLGGGSSAF